MQYMDIVELMSNTQYILFHLNFKVYWKAVD